MDSILTPARFRTMRHGAKLDGLSDFDLAETLADAQAVIDSYCNVPIGGSLMGGVVIGEQRPWRYPTAPVGEPGSRRVFPVFNPVLSIEGFRLVVGSEASASLPIDSLVIERQRRFIEVTSASIVGSSGLFGVTGWVVPFGGLSQPIAEIDYTYGRAIEEVDERIYPINDDNLIWQSRFNHWVGEVSVKAGGVDVDSGDYVVDALEGRVTFAVAPATPVELTYSHQTTREMITAASMIAADLMGASKLVSKGMTGVRRLTAGEISIERESARDLGRSLDTLLPNAALLLTGYRYWSAA